MKKLMLGLMVAFAVTAEAEIVKEYTINESLTATLDDQGVLTINGSGEIQSFVLWTYQPWADERDSIKSIVGEGVTYVGQCAFYWCHSLKSIQLPLVSELGGDAFYGCSSLTSVSLPLVTSCGVGVFSESESLQSVSLPKATTFKYYAFRGCGKLSMISIPSATSIGEESFRDCGSLDVIITNEAMKNELEKNRGYYGIGENVRICLPPPLAMELVENAGWETKDPVIEVKYSITPSSVTLKSNGEIINEEDYIASCEVYGITPDTKPDTPYTPTADDLKVVSKDAQIVQEGEVAVKKEELQAAKAEAVTVENGVVKLAVGVSSNANFTAETKDWKPVELKSENVEVKDGKVVISIPVSGDSGFMILQSGDAKVQPEGRGPVTGEPWYKPTVED